MYTEEEALKKSCKIDSHPQSSGQCCASLCMAWRWSNGREVEKHERTGYCGLAGQPTSADFEASEPDPLKAAKGGA